MRTFPRAQRSRAAAVMACCVVALASLAIPFQTASAQDDGLKHKQKQVQHALSSAKHDMDESSAAYRKAAARVAAVRDDLATARGVLSAARAKVTAAQLRDQEMQDRLEQAVARLSTARTDLASGQRDVEDQRQHVANTISDYYSQGDPRLLALVSVLESEDASDITRRLQFMDTVVDEESRSYDDLRASEVLLTVREGQVQDAKDAVAAQRAEAAQHLVEMNQLEGQAESAAASVRTQVAANVSAKQAALVARAADRAQLATLRQREARIKQRILAAARRAARSHQGYTGATSGLFNLPVSGPVTSPYGYRVHPIYGYYSLHDGTDFGAGCGQPLWAVADGTVLTEYYSSVWGNRLYLSLGNINGKNVTVIYNHLSGYRAHSGQRVSRGETLGYVGTTGWSTGCHLHFTVMVNGTPVDPMNWLS